MSKIHLCARLAHMGNESVHFSQAHSDTVLKVQPTMERLNTHIQPTIVIDNTEDGSQRIRMEHASCTM